MSALGKGLVPDGITIRRATAPDAEALSRPRLALLREIGHLADDRQVGPLLAAICGCLEARLASGASTPG